jgi:hypothetical protein
MQIEGIAQTAALAENPPGSDRIEVVIPVQGMGLMSVGRLSYRLNFSCRIDA